MGNLIAACAFFLGLHIFVSGSPLRAVIVGAIGERAYLGLFSLLSLGAITWMSIAYAGAEGAWLWTAPPAFRWVSLLLTLIAFEFVIVGLTTPSPTVTGGEARLERDDAAQGALRITRHPFLWGVALWAATHLTLNGDAASLVLFGSLLLLALVGPLLIDAKRRRVFGPKWDRFAAVTSNVPFAAIAAGRNRLRLDEIGAWRIAAAAAAWLAVVVIHPWLFGVPALPS